MMEQFIRKKPWMLGYGTTSVWCSGGSRNFEGCWRFPYLKIQKLPNFHFMFFDRYEIHIQDFEDIYGNLHHFPVPVFTKFDMGPLRSGAGVGVGMLRGAGDSLT